MKQHITNKPIPSLWFQMGSLILTICILAFTVSFQSLLLEILFFVVVITLVSMASAHIEQYLFGSEMILSDQGIETTGRIGAKNTAWNEIIQVGAMEQDMTKVLVLVKKDGKPMGEKALEDWFIFRNPGKLIWLPDDMFTRAYIAKNYGPLDFDRNRRKDE